jgi:hypothetical protein
VVTGLALTSVFIAPLSDLTAVLDISQRVESATVGAEVEVRRYAGGRQRLVSSPGTTGSFTFTLTFVIRADYLALLDLVGTPVLLRDQRARRVAGVIKSVTGTEWNVRDRMQEVSFTLDQVSWSEVV